MERGRSLHATHRAVVVDLAPEAAWAVIASGEDDAQWYADALPFRIRRLVDRLTLGPALRVRPPGRPRLRTGDSVGFWTVRAADHSARRLELLARVRAPGSVTLEASVAPDPERRAGSRVELAVGFAPRGLLGRGYLLADLPAREALLELVALHLLTVLRRDASGSSRLS